MQWSQLTWAELPDQLTAASQAAILPVGATEQHGPHMGCGMDAVIADVLCKAVAERTGVPMLPTLPYGCSLGHSRRWPGTIAVQPITLIELVKQIGDGAYHSGVRRLFIINTHVTNAAPLRCALEMLRAEHDDLMVAVINSPQISERVRAFHFADQFANFFDMQQQFAATSRVGMNMGRCRWQGCNVAADQINLAMFDDDIGFLDLHASGSDRLDFPAFQHDARLKAFLDVVVEMGFSVFCDRHVAQCAG